MTAQPPTLWTRLTRWFTRHPIATTAAACALLIAAALSTTAASIWYLNQRPAYMRWDATDHQWATLYTITGRPIKTWTAHGEKTVALGEFIDFPQELGGGKAVVVAFPIDRDLPWASQVTVYRYPDLDRPLWTSGEADPVVLPPPYERAPDMWAVGSARLVDVFDQHPGPEVVAVHASQFSQRCIRIYALADGKVLFEAWHDGAVTAPHWLPGPRLLVFSGDNHEATVEELGFTNLKAFNPAVLWALRPSLAERHAWVCGLYATPEARALVPWYRCFMPAEAWDFEGFALQAPLGRRQAQDSVEVQFNYLVQTPTGPLEAGFRRRVDATGRFAADPTIFLNAARRYPSPIDPQSIQLGDLPRPRPKD